MKDDKLYKYLLVFTLAIYCFYIGYSIKYGSFLLGEDETIFFGSAKLFAETNSIKSPDCISEEVSRIFGTGWYGPLYHILYGGIAKLTNNYALIFIAVNIISLVLTGLLMFIKSGENKIFIIFCLLSLSPIHDFLFRFTPEMMILLFGTTIYVAWLYADEATDDLFWRNTIIYVLIICILSLFRVTLIFWSLGLFFLARNKRQYLVFALIIAGCAGYILSFMKYFTAPPHATGVKSVDFLYKLDISGFVKAVIHVCHLNLNLFFEDISLYKVLLIITIIYFVVELFRLKNKKKSQRFILAISAAYMAAIFLLYSTHNSVFDRHTLVLFPGIILALGETIGKTSKLFVALFLTVFMLMSLPNSYLLIKARSKSNFDYNVTYLELRRSLYEIADVVDPGKENLILWSYDQWDYPYKATDAIIPMSSRDKKPILYTSNIVSNDANECIRFMQYGRQKIDYILSRYPLSMANLALVLHNNHLYLYRNEK